MFRQAYTVILNDGTPYRYEDTCAANAIGRALNDHRGQTVARCYSGGHINPKIPSAYGIIEYEIPRHDAAPKRVKRVKPDKTCTLFDDGEVLAESNKAREKAGLGAIDHETK